MRGIALSTTGWLILGLLTLLVIIGLIFVFRGPTEELLSEVIDRLRFT